MGVVSITNSTEVGTVYTPAEIRAIADLVHDLGWVLHLDGSRLSNAAAALGVGLRELTTDAGVDILSLGGTKCGAMLAEAVVVLSPERVHGTTFLRKQSMQLASKMRFVSAQLLALFEGDLWRRNAEHANAMARRLADGVAGIEGLELPHEVEANAVFPILPRESSERLMESFRFYFWDEASGRSGGCARGTRRRVTSTVSSRRCGPSWADPACGIPHKGVFIQAVPSLVD